MKSHHVRVLEALMVVISLVASVVLSEILLRMLVELPLPRLHPQVRYDPHPVRRFTIRTNQEAYTYNKRVEIDRKGFRTNGGLASSEARVRIFALGDSFTFGLGVADHETWPAQLESLLNAQLGGGVQVINGGVISYGVFQELDFFRERGLLTRPNIVVHGLYWNDYMTNHPPRPNDLPVLTAAGYFTWEDTDATDSLFQRGKEWLKSHSALVFTVVNALRRIREGHESGLAGYEAEYHHLIDGTIPQKKWKVIEDFYKELKRIGEEEGFVLYVVIFPVVDIVSVPDPANHAYPRSMREMLDRLSIPYLDCFTLWNTAGLGREQFLPNNRHLNASGYKVVATALMQSLTTNRYTVALFRL